MSDASGKIVFHEWRVVPAEEVEADKEVEGKVDKRTTAARKKKKAVEKVMTTYEYPVRREDDCVVVEIDGVTYKIPFAYIKYANPFSEFDCRDVNVEVWWCDKLIFQRTEHFYCESMLASVLFRIAFVQT